MKSVVKIKSVHLWKKSKIMKKSIVLLLLIIAGCAGEDACFSKKGDAVSQQHQLSGFHTIDIPMNVSAEIIPSTTFKMEIQSFENRIEAISFEVKDSILTIKNEISCQMLNKRSVKVDSRSDLSGPLLKASFRHFL